MNMPPTTPQSCVNPQAQPRETARDVDPRELQPPRDRFERALRAKQAQYDEGDADADAPPPDAVASGMALAGLPAQPHAARPAPDAPSPAGIETVKSGPRAAIEAALNANPGPHVTPIGGTDPAAVWEASVHESNSVPVEVRFTRPEKAAQETQANWTLTVGSSTVNAEMLARHAPRLNERLRKRAIGLDHVRIQRDEGDA